jgi:hypothetical protein
MTPKADPSRSGKTSVDGPVVSCQLPVVSCQTNDPALTTDNRQLLTAAYFVAVNVPPGPPLMDPLIELPSTRPV